MPCTQRSRFRATSAMDSRAPRDADACVWSRKTTEPPILDADIEGDTGAQRGLLKNQRDEFAVERGNVTDRARFDVCRQLEQFARVRRSPLRSGEEIFRQR